MKQFQHLLSDTSSSSSSSSEDAPVVSTNCSSSSSSSSDPCEQSKDNCACSSSSTSSDSTLFPSCSESSSTSSDSAVVSDCSSSSTTASNISFCGGSGLGKVKEFNISWGCNSSHPWKHHQGGKVAIHINGFCAPVLRLHTGDTYRFTIEKPTAGRSFILTTSNVGGSKAVSQTEFKPLSEGSVEIKVTEDTPRLFFYQSGEAESEGGLVVVSRH